MRHILKRNETTRLPSNVLCLDTESFEVKTSASNDSYEYPFRIGCTHKFRYEKGKATRHALFQTYNLDNLWQYIESSTSDRRSLWVFAHNLAWDLSVMKFWNMIDAQQFHLTGPEYNVHNPDTGQTQKRLQSGLLVTADPPTMVVCWTREGKKIRFVDTMNWIKKSLADIGLMVGIPKKQRPENADSIDNWYKYCHNDVAILVELVLRIFDFVRTEDLGVFKYTAASQSMAAYRHRWMKQSIYVHNDRAIQESERAAYYGGKCSLYYRGLVTRDDTDWFRNESMAGLYDHYEATGPVYALDMKQAYARVMRDCVFPYKHTDFLTDVSVDRAREIVDLFGVVALVEVESMQYEYPVKINDNTEYLVGRFSTWLAGPELRYAFDSRHVRRVYAMHVYCLDYILSDFANDMIAMENKYSENGDELQVSICKSIRNALHGKFGQHQYRWEIMPGAVSKYRWGKWCGVDVDSKQTVEIRSIGGQLQWLNPHGEIDGSFPAIAAYVTSYCRLDMNKARIIAGADRCYYQDSDSIHVSALGYRNLLSDGMIGNECGKFRQSRSPADRVIYISPKHYIWDGTPVIAGLPHSAIEFEPGRYRFTKFPSCNETVSHPPSNGPICQEKILEYNLKPERVLNGNWGWQSLRVINELDSKTKEI